MKVFKSAYTLKLIGNVNALLQKSTVEGWLLKFEFGNQSIGYSSVQTYPQFGDPTLQEIEKQLLIYPNTDSQIVKNIVNWALRDANARREHKSLNIDQKNLKNHYLVNDVRNLDAFKLKKIKDLGFKTLKFKMGKNLELESQKLKSLPELTEFKWRIDFNSTLNEENFINWANRYEELLPQIEFVEDPTLFNVEGWLKIKKKVPIKLALDFHLENHLLQQGAKTAIDTVVIKPMVDNLKFVVDWVLDHSKTCIFTTYLDHPIGQINAQLDMLKYKNQLNSYLLPCGLESKFVFEDHSYKIDSDKNKLGIGFTNLLSQENWLEIK